jgi:hypothetical protein
VVLRFYCNAASWFEPVIVKDVVAVVTPLEEGMRRVPRDGKMDILSEKLIFAPNGFEMFDS